MMETFVRVSRTRRSRTWRAVSSLPSRPASGPSLMQIFIVIVGGSMSTKGSGWRSSVSVSVSPMNTSSKPQMPTMSPALACLSLDLLQADVAEKRGDIRALALAVLVMQTIGVADLHAAADDAAVGDAAEVVAVVEVRDEHLEIAHVGLRRRRDVLDDRLEERLHRRRSSRGFRSSRSRRARWRR